MIADQHSQIPMQDRYADELAAIFGVEPAQVRITDHTVDGGRLARVRFLRGRSVATALSSYFNHEFYRPTADLNLDELHYSANRYSFIDENDGRTELCLTLDDEPSAFFEKLRKLRPDIRFVALHPEMLLALREKGDYKSARQVVEKGYTL